jgi:hypothetical protein
MKAITKEKATPPKEQLSLDFEGRPIPGKKAREGKRRESARHRVSTFRKSRKADSPRLPNVREDRIELSISQTITGDFWRTDRGYAKPPMTWDQIITWIIMPLVGSIVIGGGALWASRFIP